MITTLNTAPDCQRLYACKGFYCRNIRGVFWTLSNIQDGDFSKNWSRLKALHYFRKKHWIERGFKTEQCMCVRPVKWGENHYSYLLLLKFKGLLCYQLNTFELPLDIFKVKCIRTTFRYIRSIFYFDLHSPTLLFGLDAQFLVHSPIWPKACFSTFIELFRSRSTTV